MTSSHVCNFVPLTRNDSDHPVLYLDANAPLSDLYTGAQQRIGAARNLLEILDCASSAQDLTQICFAIGLLLSDGCDLLSTLGDKTQALNA
ncbi:hypothetical protein C4K14_2477 [Pseudomonas chlororaphis subsp. aureofaciens]|uniref:hypothetical protein n=1 Tax=Pseudomonas chlororaphis TaxID=587753 RepID=UPI000F582858|nr:hypothetical protein [Pseudomonas chlororaphis]AZD85301.1 hypothetical protein C4K14_2477 [Pseudomonas chlororaphis subsp. aureofaciens]